MKKTFLLFLFIAICHLMKAQVRHHFSINYCGITYYDKYGFNFGDIKEFKFKVPPFSYKLQLKRVGFELFYSRIKSGFVPWNEPQDPFVLNKLIFRDRENIGVCFHYLIVKNRIINLSALSGVHLKGSNDYTYLFTYYGSFPEPKYALNNELGFGIVTGANAKLFFHKRMFFNATVRQMNLIDNSKFQRNVLMTEFGLGVRFGKL